MDVLYEFVAPIAAGQMWCLIVWIPDICPFSNYLKNNVKVDWSSRHFSQNFNKRIKHGLLHYCCQIHRVMLNIEGDRCGDYRGKLEQSIIHRRSNICVNTWPRKTMPDHISPESATFISTNQSCSH